MKKNTVLKKLANHLWVSFMLVIILVGVLVSIGRLASPYLKEFKADIQAEASRIIGTRVSIGDIDASWKGFGPKLILRNIEIRNTQVQTAPLILRRIDLDLSIKSILQKGEFLPWNITLHGIRLQLIQDKSGKISVTGLSADNEKGDTVFNVDPLLKMRRIQLADTALEWIDLTGKTPKTSVEHINLLIRNDNTRHQLDLAFSLPGTDDQKIQIAADFRAETHQLENFSGDFYIKTENFQAAKWVRSLIPDFLKLKQLTMHTELWLSAENGNFHMAEGKLSLENLKLTNNQDKVFILNRAESFFHWHGDNGNHHFSLRDFLLDAPGLDATQLALRYSREKDQQAYLRVSEISLDIWPRLVDFLAQQIPEQLAGLDITGIVNDLQASWSPGFSDWSAQGELKNFSINPHQKIPGASNISATFIASSKGGAISIDSTDSRYLHPSLFREPVPLNSLQGDLKWQISTENAIHISSDYLTAISPHLTTATRLSVNIPADGSTYLDLQTDFKNGDGSGTGLYLPYGIMNDKLVNWLDRAIVSGTVTSGSFVFKGPADDFAFSKTHNGHFEVLFNVEDVILDYLQQWPRLEEVDAHVRFHNNSLDIDLVSAKYLNSEIHQASAHIHSLNPLSPLEVNGTASGPIGDSMDLLSTTTLKEEFGTLAKALSFTGNNKVQLDFDIPLGNIGEYAVDGSVEFRNNQMLLADWNLQLEKIKGRLKFSLDGLESDKLSASFLGSPAVVKVSHDNKRNTVFDSTVALDTTQLSNIIQDFPVDIINGSTDWNIRLTLPPLSRKDSAAQLKVYSALEGLQIDAPAPFGKRTNSVAPLSVKASLTPGQELPLSFNYNDIASAKLLLLTPKGKPFSLKSGVMHFGSSEPPQITDNLFQLTGTIDTLALDSWLSWQPLMKSKGQNPLPIKIDLSSQKLSYRELSLTGFSLKANKNHSRLVGQISSEELTGKFEIPSFNPLGKLIIDLEKAALSVEGDTPSTENTKAQSGINPKDVPAMDLKIKSFIINDHEFGKVLVQTSKKQQNIKLDQLLINGELLNFDGNGLWSDSSGQQRTLINFKMDSSEFGTVLQNLGFTPQIDKGKAAFEGHVSWNGAPHNFNTDTLSGELGIIVEKGRFLDFEPGMGRILGILNVAALYRRLTLDFSDLFREGFTFDSINADFVLDAGNAYTDNLMIKSPAATVELNGRTGLAIQDYEQQVTVTPSLQSTITIAGAVAGGPAGAAIAYLAQKLVGKQVDKIARTRYSISGSWEAPNIIELKIPEKVTVEEPDDLGILKFE
ncbi:MAG: TIGR02099 family protein [Gammaproteobacteria bacterium]|nr:TIGR02099 family protein [Gammaproteobacteria bacterium]